MIDANCALLLTSSIHLTLFFNPWYQHRSYFLAFNDSVSLLVIGDITVVNCLHCFRYNYIGKFEISRSLSHILYILWVSTCLFMYPIPFPPPTTKPCKQQKEFRILKIQKQDVKKLIIQKILNIIQILTILNFSYY